MLYEEILTQLEKDFDEFEYLDLIDFNSKLQIINRLDKTLKDNRSIYNIFLLLHISILILLSLDIILILISLI